MKEQPYLCVLQMGNEPLKISCAMHWNTHFTF